MGGGRGARAAQDQTGDADAEFSADGQAMDEAEPSAFAYRRAPQCESVARPTLLCAILESPCSSKRICVVDAS